ncbi:RlpA-like double-psi beta-barrel-protein domain-containing protein-containing protein [Lactarius vividus]|nr:RlpA-like double-psi beta-barrel-protein domain-containing protein-containing protein [Lactarius vividus]
MRALTQSIATVIFFTLFQLISAQSRLKGNSHEKRFPIQRRHTTHLAKRFANARFTYYVVGLGACGHYNKPSDFIVALNSAQYGNGGYCGATITITYGGKSTPATVMDEATIPSSALGCPGCPYAGLDLSEGLFSFFASTNVGTFYGEWEFGSSENEPKSTSTTPKSTSTPSPSPTTNKKLGTSTTSPITSSTTTTTTTTSSKLSSTTYSVPSSSSSTTTTTSSSSVSTTSPTPADDADTLYQMTLALVQLCTFVEGIIEE